VDFDLSPEQLLLRDTVREFVAANCDRELARRLDDTREFPYELWRRLADLGLLGLQVSEDDGGSGGTPLDALVVVEELARGAVAVAVPFVNTAGLAAKVIAALGSEEQRARLLPELLAGRLLASFAWTEPVGGTDVLALQTRAVSDGDDYVVTGTKTFITLASVADYLFTIVRTLDDQPKRTQGLTCLLIAPDTPGVELRRIDKAGQRATEFFEVRFDDVRVPASQRIGPEHDAWRSLVPLLNGERTMFAGICLGLAKTAFADALRYTAERSAFGKTINHFQALQHHVADMKLAIDSCELLAYRAAWLESAGRPTALEATQAFLASAQMVSMVTDLGLQLMGGYGYTTDFDMERYWRDARVFRVSPITTEMAKNVVAQGLGMPRSY
jgi:acyl-CoA dehydrogenase